jgi:hypothetical protein
VGEITIGGTVAFILFAGLLFGAYAGILWVTVAPWVPGKGLARALATGLLAVAIASFFVVRSDERDFQLLQPPGPSIVMLIVIVASLGAVIAVADDRLRRRLPDIDPADPLRPAYVALTGLGLLVAPIIIAAYFLQGESPAFRPPAEVGLGLLVVGILTLGWWMTRVRDGTTRPPLWMTVAARGALGAAMFLGTMRLLEEASTILSGA